MSYVAYYGLTTPNEILDSIQDYLILRGFTIVQSVTNDLDIYQQTSSDGNRMCFQDRTGDYYVMLRTANGTNIFGTNDEAVMNLTTPDGNVNYTGIGMTVGEGYSAIKRWYNQEKVPLKLKANLQTDNSEVLGVFMPVKVGTQYTTTGTTSSPSVAIPYTYTLYCNEVTTPTSMLVFSIVLDDISDLKQSTLSQGGTLIDVDEVYKARYYKQCAHLAVGNLQKFENRLANQNWEGGAIFSGSATKDMMATSQNVFTNSVTSDSAILPIFSSGTASNTFLRIDIDNAPTAVRGTILWASSGTANETGKPMSLPIRTSFPGTNGAIPHYYYMQSKSRLDWGRNINTLNCLTIDMPLYVAVRIDPDASDLYSAAGIVSGIYYISMLNMQTGKSYERDYPNSNKLCQVFPFGKRRGYYGFDGFSIKQDLDTGGGGSTP